MRSLSVFIVCFLSCIFVVAEDNVKVKVIEKEKEKEKVVYNYADWQQIKNEKLKFALKLPADWKFLEQKEPTIQAYFAADKDDPEGKLNSAKKLLVESKTIGDDLKKVGDDMVKVIKSGQGGKAFIREKESKLGELPAREVVYHYREDGFEKTADVVIVKYKNSYFSFSFITSSQYNEHSQPLKNQILATINFDVMQPSSKFEFKKPKDWFDFKDNEYSQAFARKDQGANNPKEGIIKLKVVHIDEDKTLQQFTMDLVSKVTKNGAITSGFATTSPINGKQLMWFDVVDKDNLFKERYHIAKDGYSFYIIYFISNNELFEKELKMVLAESLLTFKVLSPK